MSKATFYYKDDHNKSQHLQMAVNEDSNQKMLLNLGNDISASHVRREDGNHPYRTLYKIKVEIKADEPAIVYKVLPGDPQELEKEILPTEPEDNDDEMDPDEPDDEEGPDGFFDDTASGGDKGSDDATDPEADNTQKTSKPHLQQLPVSARQIQVQKPETVAKKTHNFFEKRGQDQAAFDATLSMISMEETVLMSPASYNGKSLKREFYHDLLMLFFGRDHWSEEMFLQFEKISRFFEKGERGRLKKMYKRLRQLAGMQAILAAAEEEVQSLETVTIIFKKMIPVPNGPPDPATVR